MFTTIITDCWGENEKGRQIARFNSLGLGPTDLIGVASNFTADATIEGGVNLIDILDATEGKPGVIVVNVAPRGDKNEGTNGNSFSYFYYKKTLIISTVKGYCLSAVKEFGITKNISIVDIPSVLIWAIHKKLLHKNLEEYITNTQFRSFDFVPRLARWLSDNQNVPHKDISLIDVPSLPSCVWHIDAFGNAKTTIWNIKPNIFKPLKSNFGNFNFYNKLKDLPHSQTAFYIGSSGLKEKRFLEIASQGVAGSAKNALGLKIGDTIVIK